MHLISNLLSKIICLLMLSSTALPSLQATNEKNVSNASSEMATLQKQMLEIQKQMQALEKKVRDADARATKAETNAIKSTQSCETNNAQSNFDPGFITTGPDSAIKFGGYVRLDAIYDAGVQTGPRMFTQNLPVEGANLGSTVPNSVSSASRKGHFAFNAQQSRLNITGLHKIKDNEVKAFIEFDFYGADNTPTSSYNTYTPRLRHGYGKYKNWLLGQTFNTFVDLGTVGQSLDINGISGGIIFNPMIRYTYKEGGFNLALALEQSNTDYSYIDKTNVNKYNATSNQLSQQSIPDFVTTTKYTFTNNHYIGLSGMLRKLHVKNPSASVSQKVNGWALGVYGKYFSTPKDNFFAVFNFGQGAGRYINEATGLSAIYNSNSATDTDKQMKQLSAPGVWQAYLGYCHYWKDNWSSNIAWGKTRFSFSPNVSVYLVGATNPITDLITKKLDKFIINTIYSPIEKVDLGLEYFYSLRETRDGLKGKAHRIQFAATYKF